MKKHIVIGGGIVGASTAYHLAKAGERVMLVDRQDQGQATEAGAGIICPWLTNRSNKSWYKLVENGAAYYPELIQELEKDGETNTGYERVGAINIFDTDEKLDRKMEVALKRRETTPEMGEVTRLSAEETNRLFPVLSKEYGAVYVSGAARVQGGAVRDALVRAAEKNGAELINGDASLVYEGNRVTGVKVGDDVYESDQVCVTGGAWAKEILKPLGLHFEARPQKAQIIHLDLPESNTKEWPVVLPPYNHYILAFDHGRIVVGATKEDEAGFNPDVTIGGVNELLDKVLRVAPGLADSQYVQTKVGFRPFTPGSRPVLGEVPGIQGLFVANGLGASGLTSGPYFGAELANIAMGTHTKIDLKDFDPGMAIQ
ncbi:MULTISPECIES: NAD(P)/FAD-dependent oxidoreductase [Pontibacillus]|uniref:FAD-dependent oxidoreductase n=1 Tax=Pontibacillus chungwhensis TaxID=265426 RepID=A0ABY8UW40_9BACI|nr:MULTISPECIES: FAD-dependent oxidoreductase [Pontibacillus]MCD5323255.1 FAD-binding oxidoreductase [Pontibacillus sp. HN14]WIF96640.1 FAD-dependent oxidoreductase [Pontibacillus chungwhensis]